MNIQQRPGIITDAYIQYVIAHAIKDVAQQEYSRLATGLQPSDIMERLTEALVELRGLSRGEMPNYSPWTGLCYLTWYQPHHINLAFTMLHELSDAIRRTLDGARNNAEFRWIDFGCGSLPMHIALSAASAVDPVLPSSGSSILGIGIDTSEHMLKLGNEVVRAIKKLDPRLTRACKNLYTGATLPVPSRSPWETTSVPTVLSVMHAFYRENISDVEAALTSLIRSSNPELIFVTAHTSAERLVDRAFSRQEDRYDYVSKRFDYPQALRFSGELKAITAFRYGLADLIEIERANVVTEGLSARQDHAGVYHSGYSEWDVSSRGIRNSLDGSDLQFLNETDMAIKYLSRKVWWSGAEVDVRIYFRKHTRFL